jgi:hypothetical protein
MSRTGATGDTLPVSTNRLTIPHGENFVGSKCEGGKRVVPEHVDCTFDDFMGVTAKTNGTGGIDPSGCARLKVRPKILDRGLDIWRVTLGRARPLW